MSVYSWVGGNGSWLDANDWAPGGVPSASDIVYFTQGGSAYDVTTDGAVASLITIDSASATLEDNGSLYGGSILLQAGTLTVDAGATLVGATFLSGGALNVAGTLQGCQIVLNSGTVNLENGATLSNVVFDGVLNVENTTYPINVTGSLVVNDVSGENPGIVNIVNSQLNFTDDDILDAMTINLGDPASDQGGYLALAPQGDGGDAAISFTLGVGAVVNSNGNGDSIFVANGGNASTVTNYGAIHQLDPSGLFEINLETGLFTNSGLIDSYSGGTVYITSAKALNAGLLSVGSGSTLDTLVDSLTANISSRINIGAGSTWSVAGQNVAPVVLNYGAIALAGGAISGASGLTFTNLATGAITGYGTISQATLVNQGLIDALAGTLNLATTITGAGTLKASATANLGDDVTQNVVTETATGHINIAGKMSLTVVKSAAIAGAIGGLGAFVVDAGASAAFGPGASVSTGGIDNAGTINFGASNLTAPDAASINRIQNTGAVNVTGAAKQQALLTIGVGASFGTSGVVTGAVTLKGDSAISFASGSFSSIATGASLLLGASDAYLEDATALGANSALTLLTTISGGLTLENGAAITTTRNLTNNGNLTLDYLAGEGGSHVTDTTTLTNAEDLTIGNSTLSAASGVTAATFVNSGLVTLQGGAKVEATISTTSGFTNNGTFTIASGEAEVSGAANGTGDVILGNNATLTYDGSVGSGQMVDVGATDVLALKSAGTFAGKIQLGPITGDTLDVMSLAHSGASFNFVENGQLTGGMLTLSNASQSVSLSLIGDYKNNDFSLAADAGTGTLVKYI